LLLKTKYDARLHIVTYHISPDDAGWMIVANDRSIVTSEIMTVNDDPGIKIAFGGLTAIYSAACMSLCQGSVPLPPLPIGLGHKHDDGATHASPPAAA
jgi:hypothetical protein